MTDNMRHRRARGRHVAAMAGVGLLLLLSPPLLAQEPWVGLQTFGFFQSQFQVADGDNDDFTTSFSTQQLNLFLQHRIGSRWFAFVNLEAVNSYSSRRSWGSFSLEEAWVRYSFRQQHSLKIGQFIPTYNGFNEIKNRMPVFPYISRPLVYESSYDEFLALEEYWPARGYLQASGWFVRYGNKLEYALYLGNSPNINSDPRKGQTGIDTTDAMLVGGRLGLRRGNLAGGLSYTREHVHLNCIDNTFVQLNRRAAEELGWDLQTRLLRRRYGWDLSWSNPRLFLDAESTDVDYSGIPFLADPPTNPTDVEIRSQAEGPGGPTHSGEDSWEDSWEDAVDEDEVGKLERTLLEAVRPSLDKHFFYITVGVHPTEHASLYGSLSRTQEDLLMDGLKMIIRVRSVGGSFQVNDRVVLKAQYARNRISTDVKSPLDAFFPVEEEREHNYLGALAVSVFF